MAEGEFNLPVHYEDLEAAGDNGDGRFRVETKTEIARLSEKAQGNLLDDVTETLDSSALQLCTHSTFDPLYSFVADFDKLSTSMQERVHDVLCHVPSEIRAAEPRFIEEGEAQKPRTALKMAVLLLTECTMRFEQRADDARSKLDWEGLRLKTMEALESALRINLHSLWKASPEEEFITLFVRSACKVCESAAAMRCSSVQTATLRVLARAAQVLPSVSTSMQMSLMKLLLTHGEHTAPVIAELGRMMCSESFGRNDQVMKEMFNEVRQMPTESSGLKFVGKFVEELAARHPSLVLQVLSSALLCHLDGDNYSMRSSILTAIAAIVRLKFSGAHNSADTDVDTVDDRVDDEDEDQKQRAAETRDQLLGILEQRLRDHSSWTRAAVLKSWIQLVEQGSVPHKQLPNVTRVAVERLRDKSSLVRKQAIILFRTLLENNPFAGDLDPAHWASAVKSIENWFTQNPVPTLEHVKCQLSSLGEQTPEEAADSAEVDHENEADQSQEPEEDTNVAEQTDEVDDDTKEKLKIFAEMADQHKKNGAKLDFARAGFHFATLMTKEVIPLLVQFIGAKAVSDVQETLRFFTVAHTFALPGVEGAIRKMLGCVWSHEPTGAIRKEAVDSIYQLYIAAPGEERKKLPPGRIARNLVLLARDCSHGELGSLGQAIKLLMQDGKLGSPVIEELWKLAEHMRCTEARKMAKTEVPDQLKSVREDSRVALHILAMAARASPSVIGTTAHREQLFEVGLGDLTMIEGDFVMARNCCVALKLLPVAPVDDQIINAMDKLHAMLVLDSESTDVTSGVCWTDNSSPEWFPAAQEAIDTIFMHDAEPEQRCERIIRAISAKIFGSTRAQSEGTASSLQLSRLFFVLGHVALKMLVRTEEMASNLKKMRAARKKALEEEGGDKDAMEDELDTAAEADAESEEQAQKISECHLVQDNLLGAFGPMIEAVVMNQDGTFSDPLLRRSAAMALSKFMAISVQFCERNLKLLFTALLHAPDACLRANTIVALGDLAFRFPNSIEPWTDRLYAPLRDSDIGVRKNTLQVLSHLILNDMVKVKGKISDICVCLEDGDSRIKGLANLFFDELSKRHSNPIYNLLPDIISSLSRADSVTPQCFQDIMQYLMGPKFVKKEQQTLALVEKLCQRFPATFDCDLDVHTARNVAFCLQSLKFDGSDKAANKLIENKKFYKAVLGDDEVYNAFATIMKKMKKSSNVESATAWSEWQVEVERLHEQGSESLRASENAARNALRAQKQQVDTAQPLAEANNNGDNTTFPADEASNGKPVAPEADAEGGVEAMGSDTENTAEAEDVAVSPKKAAARTSRRRRATRSRS